MAVKIKENDSQKSVGISAITAAIFVAGEMVGSGVLALPRAVVNVGWIGIPLLAVFCIFSGYGGTRLGACWTILEERFPELRGHVRDPYPTIGEKAFGKTGRYLVQTCIFVTLFGTTTVTLLLAANMVEVLLQSTALEMSYCHWQLVLAAILLPLTWLGSPKDFWPVAVMALATTSLACLLTFVQLIIHASETLPKAIVPAPTTKSSFLAFGTVLFAFGGAATFPTIQNDMKQRSRFSLSVTVAFIGILLLYMLVCVVSFFVLGDQVDVNVLNSTTPGPLVTTARIAMAIHLVFAFVILLNPLTQGLEAVSGVPDKFHWKRCILRTVVLIFVTFAGQSVPSFGKILDLVGGSTITLLTFVLPPIFYIRLCHQKSPQWSKKEIPLHIMMFLCELIVLGFAGGVAATYSALLEIVGGDSFTPPCYISS